MTSPLSALSKRIRASTLCSGIGAPEMAMPEWDWLWCAEIAAFPSEVLRQRYGHQNLGSIAEPGFVSCALDLAPPPHVMIAGTPCQDFSVAGLRAGLRGDRGNLTLRALQILDELDDAARSSGQPPVTFVWENVPGVLSDKTNAFGCLLAGLVGHDTTLTAPDGRKWPSAGMVSGPKRRAAWRVLDAQYFGLAQRRERVFLVGSADGGADPAAVLLEPQSLRRHPPARRGPPENPASTLAGGSPGGRRYGLDADTADSLQPVPVGDDIAHTLRGEGFDASEDGTGRAITASGVPRPVPSSLAGTLLNNSRAAGSATTQDAVAGLLVPTMAFGGNRRSGPVDVASALLAQPGTKFDFESETFIAQPVAFSCKDSGQDAGAIAPTLRAMGGDRANGGGQVAVAFDARQSDVCVYGDRTGTLDTQQNSIGVCFVQNSRAEVRLVGGDGQSTGAITAEPGVQQQHYIAEPAQPQWRVRRLRPGECEALQGFPQGHTHIAWRGKNEDQCPDGPRYMACGNSMAVPVLRWILSRVEASLRARGTMS